MFEAVRRFADSIFGRSSPSAASARNLPVRYTDGAYDRGAIGHSRARHEIVMPTRVPAEVEMELQRLRTKLKRVEDSLEQEHDFTRASGGRSNQGIVDALNKRVDQIHSQMRKLAGELSTTLPDEPASRPRFCPPRSLRSKALDRAEPPATDRSLVQAARATFKRGKFANASERAIFQKIISDMREGGPELQLRVLERLGELKSVAAVPVFRAASRHTEEAIRVAALRGALVMRHPATRDIFQSALHDRSYRVRVQAVRGIYGLDDPALNDLLCAQLADPHPKVRRAAATYISWRRVPDAERHLITNLRDEVAEVRSAVVHALGHCGHDRSVFRVIIALNDEDAEVRKAAFEALGKLAFADSTEIEFDLEADEKARAAAAKKLKAWWKTERVRRLIGDDEAAAEAAAAAEPEAKSEAAGEETEAAAEAEGEAGLDDEAAAAGEETDEGGGLDESPDLDGGEGDAGEGGLDDETPDGLEGDGEEGLDAPG